MAAASFTNNWQAPLPGNPPLKVGDTFTVKMGKRRIVWEGVRDYFHREYRRYLCVIVGVKDEVYRESHYRDHARRCVATVQVVEIA